MRKKIQGLFHWFYKSPTPNYHPVSKDAYLAHFGITAKEPQSIPVEDTDKVKLAYERACANRVFEISKFWSRGLEKTNQ